MKRLLKASAILTLLALVISNDAAARSRAWIESHPNGEYFPMSAMVMVGRYQIRISSRPLLGLTLSITSKQQPARPAPGVRKQVANGNN